MPIDWNAASEELAKPLDVAAIKPPAPGKYGEYIDGLHAISEANRIFGYDGWSYTITRLECVSNKVFSLNGNNGPYEQARVAYLCTVQARVGEVVREGAACGTGNGKPENIGDVMESAIKEAETDALKRALRTLGNTFGLALYEKDKSRRQTTDNVFNPAPFIDRIEKANTGKELLAIMNGEGCDYTHPDIIKARRAKLKTIVKGAQSVAAVDAILSNFSPDADALKDAAEARRAELANADLGGDHIPYAGGNHA